MMMGAIASNSTAMSEYVANMNAVRLEVAPSLFWSSPSAALSSVFWSHVRCICHIARRLPCAFTCGMRNISSGAVIATQYFPGEVVSPSCAARCFSKVLASIIGHLFECLTGEERTKQRKRVEAGRDALAR